MDAKTFFELDFQATLYPLKTNLFVMQYGQDALRDYTSRILSDDPAHVSDNFLTQTRVHAAKPKNHLRRTVVLDPVASYFLYDLISRNRTVFGKTGSEARVSFGYRFEDNQLVPVHRAYQDFNLHVDANVEKYRHRISFDIASYFNSIYHHDATNWFGSLPGVSGVDANAFGRFFREINAGRSIDFLPQGIYPAKMIGSEFLRFVELSGQVRCAQTLRFMDDIYLFDDDDETLVRDFHRIQELLGLRALNVNPSKTIVDTTDSSVYESVSAIQEELASIVDSHETVAMYLGSGIDESVFFDDEVVDGDEPPSLDDVQIDRLLMLLVDSRADETDVELILRILHEHTDSIATYIPYLLAKFPNIVKQLYKLAGLVADKEALTRQIIELVERDEALIEYQLFWLAVIAEDHLASTPAFGRLILKLYERTSEHKIARAKILEIPDQSFGLKEIRDEVLKSGTSDWLCWAAAIGTRTLKKSERNHALKYFGKSSALNHLIAQCVQRMD